MRIDRRFLGWGVFFIVAGGVALAVRGGYLSTDQIGQVWRLWPLLLVGLGVAIILGRTSFGWIGGLLLAATFGLLAGSAISGGFAGTTCGFNSGGGTSGGGAEATIGGELAEAATVELTFDCGQLNLATGPGSAWSLTYRQDRVPRLDQSPQRLHVSAPEDSVFGQGSNWRMTLPIERTVALDVVANGASAELNLANARLSRFSGVFNAGSFGVDLSGAALGGLDVRANAGSGTLTLPAGTFSGRIDVNAGSLNVCAPAGTGLRIVANGALSSTDFSSSGLVQSGSTWESPGYAAAATKIDLTLSANAASVTLGRDGGCS
jgi:LiaI-LiaF-like transmembrane region